MSNDFCGSSSTHTLRVRLVRELRGEGRGEILTEGRRDILIKNMFGSRGGGDGDGF